ncbi:MAG TPA: type IVB secretion system protein IcmH/DotU [Steroidobacteraceae bacterium]|nr:type IVB secretion system protein IcmH/DotU [Steroidobacteraceae bacterium]
MAENTPDDPFAPREGTVLRPRPGGGRRAAGDFAAGGATAFRAPGAAAPAAAGAPPTSPAGALAALTEFSSGTRNPILEAAAPLLTLAARLGTSVQPANVATLRQQAVQEVRNFDERMRAAGVPQEDALVARYVLCTFIDSAVSNTPWGHQGGWASQSLLVMFHREVSGGEKFFDIIERLRSDPRRYIDLIELMWVCLALGYEGKYRHDPNGRLRLGELQQELSRLIRERRQLRDAELSPQWKGVEDRRNPVMRYVPWWAVAAAAAALVTVTFVVLHTRLGAQAQPIKAALAAPAVTVNYPAAVPAPANRLKQLLASEEAAHHLTVEEFGNKTVVTLTSPDLFRSGSARVNPALYATLREVAQALNQVPGHVVIVGHTDDQPVRSLQYADNVDLSKARAVSVAQILKPALANFGRVEWQGAGSSQPRYRPVETPENRARNRRVEIIQVEGAGGAQ